MRRCRQLQARARRDRRMSSTAVRRRTLWTDRRHRHQRQDLAARSGSRRRSTRCGRPAGGDRHARQRPSRRARAGARTPRRTPRCCSALLAALRRSGAQAVAMEVSSIGLDQGRVNARRVRRRAVHQPHARPPRLPRHMAAYGAAKARLFRWPGLAAAVLNVDDAFGARLAARGAPAAARDGCMTYGPRRPPTIRASAAVAPTRDRASRCTRRRPGGRGELAAPLVGALQRSPTCSACSACCSRAACRSPTALAALRAARRRRPAACSGCGGGGRAAGGRRLRPHARRAGEGAARRCARRRGARRRARLRVRLRRRPRRRQAAADGRDRGARSPTAWSLTSDNPRSEDPRRSSPQIVRRHRRGAAPSTVIELDRARRSPPRWRAPTPATWC